MEAMRRKVYIGVGVGVLAMVLCTSLMFLVLVFRRRYLQRDDKYLKRVELANGFNPSDSIDMTRSVAWSYRNGFRRPEGRGPALADSPYDPTLRPLHGQNDPFFHRERQAQNGYSHSSSGRGSYSDRSGHIAIVPFRESNLPVADASPYDVDGRIRVPNGHARGAPSAPGGRREDFPGARTHRTRRNPVESSLGFDDELFDIAAGRRPPDRRDLNRDVPHWRRDSNNPWMENTHLSSSADTSTENPASPLHGRRGSPTGQNINFSRDHRHPERNSSHLQDVYY